MNAQRKVSRFKLILWSAIALSGITANGSVMAIGPGAFPAGSPLVTFTGLPDGMEVNGLSVSGLLFSYSLGNGLVNIDGGPGPTNNIGPPNVVSIPGANNSGVLRIALPGFSDMFGYGYAVLNFATVSNATTISLFSGTTNVGSLSYNGVPDPAFAGGFAGIQSTIPFNNVGISFNSAAAPAFALDNVRFGSGSAIPEPSTMLLIVSGCGVLWATRHKSLS